MKKYSAIQVPACAWLWRYLWGAGLLVATVSATAATDNLLARQPASDKPVEVIKLASDINASQFLIFIRTKVAPHKHLTHSESLYVLAGAGEMQLGERRFAIGAGDFVQIPMGAVHGVTVTSAEPLKVLSIQAPEFDGTDRVWITGDDAGNPGALREPLASER